METTWSWDRLLPWTFGYVPFDFYLVYLSEYFYRNTPAIFNVHAVASNVSSLLSLPSQTINLILFCSLASLHRCKIMLSSV